MHVTTIGPIEAAFRKRWKAAWARLNPPKPVVKIEIRDLTPAVVSLPLGIGTPAPQYTLHYGVPQKRLMIEDVIKAACKFYGVSKEDFKSSRRTANLIRPRHMAAYLAKTKLGCSLPEIGRRFGGRDHTTILHGVRKIEALRQTDETVYRELIAIESVIEASNSDAYKTTTSASCSYLQTQAA